MTTSRSRAWIPSVAVLFVLSCSNGSSSSSSSGCGSGSSTQVCDIDTMATTCGDKITLECHDGAKPYSKTQCKEAIKQDTEVIYCCVNNAEHAASEGGDSGGGGSGGGS